MQYILPCIYGHLNELVDKSENPTHRSPFILAVTGLQGSGKSTWSSEIVKAIQDTGLNAKTISLDDLYLCHEELIAIRDSHPNNKLLRTRGQPGTHDIELAKWFFHQFDNPGQQEILFPVFDKSKYGGEGDRLPESEWNRSMTPVDVLVFEGWCVGFQALSQVELESVWKASKETLEESTSNDFPIKTLAEHNLCDIVYINDRLKIYGDNFMGPQHFDFLVHLDTDDLKNVYMWRLQQEEHLRRLKGIGMTDGMVIEFGECSVNIVVMVILIVRSFFQSKAICLLMNSI